MTEVHKKPSSNASIYISGIGCFLVFIALIIAFIFVARYTYTMYVQQSEEEMIEVKKHDHYNEIESPREETKQATESAKDELAVFRKMIQYANDPEKITTFLDNLQKNKILSSKQMAELERLGRKRIKQLQNKKQK